MWFRCCAPLTKYSVVWPEGVIFAMPPRPGSVTHSFPSGPFVIPNGFASAPGGTKKSVLARAAVENERIVQRQRTQEQTFRREGIQELQRTQCGSNHL